MQFQHSRTPGAVPNLLPGEVGVNLADGIIYVRSRGRKLAIPIDDFNAQAAPSGGVEGAPIVRHAGSVGFDFGLVPSALLYGKVHVDMPPSEGYDVPGAYITGLADPATIVLDPQTAIVETFEIASDDLTVTGIAYTAVASGGAVIVGIADSAGAIVYQTMIGALDEGLNRISLNLPLAPGRYFGILWSDEEIELSQLQCVQVEQGWDFDIETGAARFVNRKGFAATDLSAGLVMQELITTTSAAPGERRSLLYDWTIG